ncbi:hypothetical protein K438DRAFT_1978827 [Mycena galopus ATCC 62051]|nr:hypothetical protein K438DRAFT_1978827 [Mycena galopus ATCC 62051]
MSLSDLRKMSESAFDAGKIIPCLPSVADLRPNVYPYPIATTATGVFSRANSLSSPASGGEHHYVPPSHASEDMYLPSHLPSVSASNNGEYTGGGNAPRALPVPPSVSANNIAARNAAAAGSYSAYAASGTSPKRWTPAQLAAHLNTTGAPEAGAWTTTHNVGGRAFMRMGEELRGMGTKEY